MTKLAWEIELKRQGRWWTWSAYGSKFPRSVTIFASTNYLIGRRSRDSAERAARRAIARIERGGTEKLKVSIPPDEQP